MPEKSCEKYITVDEKDVVSGESKCKKGKSNPVSFRSCDYLFSL
jgi:hypothetical protein